MPTATLTSKGQVTIPKEVRSALGLKAGDRLDFTRAEGGAFRLEARKTDIRSLAGMLYRKGRKRVSIEEMDAAIARVHAKRP